MKKYAIIVAGGHGQRLGSEIPKQFLLVNNRPVIFYSIEKLSVVADEVVVVLPQSHFHYWKELCKKFHFQHPVQLVVGGVNRASSVMNGLAVLDGDGVVAIHDAVRPLVTLRLIAELFDAACIHGSAVPVIPLRESLRIKENSKTRSVNREDFLVVQTPQCFNLNNIRKAYNQALQAVFSDDAGVFENAGMAIHHIEGESSNIKITFKEDITIAEALLKIAENDEF